MGQRAGDGAVLRALAVRQGQPDAAVGFFQVFEADGGELRPPQRAGEADQQDRAIAQAAQIGRHRHQQPAQDGGGCRDFLARQLALAGGVPPDAGERLGDADVVGRHCAAGGAVQVADRGAAQFQGLRRQVFPPRSPARKAATSALAAGRAGRSRVRHQAHQARTAAR
jgi:hypothetical protein